jgi:hypothetical protein
MADQLPDVPSLRAIDPPPGGLARLRDAIERDGERRSSRRRWWYATAPIAVLIALVLWLRRDPDGIVEVPVEPPVAMPDPAIAPTFYWVASTPAPSPPVERPVDYVAPSSLEVVARELK